VIDGALALAIPTRYGQKMTIKKTSKSDLFWKSYDHNNQEWFKGQFSLYDFSAVKTNDKEKAEFMTRLLKGAVRHNSEFLSKWNGFDVTTRLEFSRDWGLGSSSSLIYLLAQWADVNPLLLHFEVSEGSGYDVACAGADYPIQYQLDEDAVNYSEIDFEPPFADKLYFIYLNKKQSSKTALDYYFKKAKKRKTLAAALTDITKSIIECQSLTKFIKLIEQHELLVSEHLMLQTVKSLHFQDFDGAVKSLGAWGGDFIMAATEMSALEVKAYFNAKGFDTIIPFNEMIYSENPVSVSAAGK
jgi:mevalonate kinase